MALGRRSFLLVERLLTRPASELPFKAAAIVVLAGGNGTRERQAAALFKSGISDRVLLTSAWTDVQGHRIELAELMLENLVREGVPRSRIGKIPGDVRSTAEEARRFREHCSKEQLSGSVLIVTDRYHSRRARRLFRSALKGLAVQPIAAPCPESLLARSDLSMARRWGYLVTEAVKLSSLWFRLEL